jgi:single-strand DNA-binding protein
MSASLNKVTLIGNLGKDPELRTTSDGKQVATFSVATSESWTDRRSGDRMGSTEWHRIVVWNEHLVKVAGDYLKKGSKVYLEGKLQTRKWKDGNGVERYATEIVLPNFGGIITILSGGKKDDAEGDDQQHYAGQDYDDEVPF